MPKPQQQKQEREQEQEQQPGQSGAAAIDDDHLKAFVDGLLKDPKVNLGFVPDAIERTLYLNVLRIGMGAMKKTCDETAVEFMGHRIRVVIEPIGHDSGASSKDKAPASKP
jgi:hypothetical protein